MQLTFEEVIGRTNREARWPSPPAPNRLFPECWPAIKPKFKLEQGERIFGIGSCFARHIERRLSELGFEVPTVTFFKKDRPELGFEGVEAVNRFTPTSMYQELAWTKAILERDGHVAESDIEPFLFSLPNGMVLDLQRIALKQAGFTRAEALQKRRAFFELFREAFTCPVVILTPGLIEGWYDTLTGQYVEYNAVFRQAPSRFVFRRLDYPECLDCIERTLDLLGPDKRILLTVSPIPLGRTMTSDDVIVANTYSKSVLRAVVGKACEGRDNVDYFPSYESIMLTRQEGVWQDDLLHVDAAFVARIMQRVVESYVDDVEAPATEDEPWLQFEQLMNQRRFEAARDMLPSLLPADILTLGPKLQHLVAVLFYQTGDLDLALPIARGLLAFYSENRVFPTTMYYYYCIFRMSGEPELAERALARLSQSLLGSPAYARGMLQKGIAPNDGLFMEEIVARILADHGSDPEIVNATAGSCVRHVNEYIRRGDLEQAETWLERFEKLLPASIDFARLRIALAARRLRGPRAGPPARIATGQA